MKQVEILYQNIKLQALITEREGMITENKNCEYRGESPNYYEDSFRILADKIKKLLKEPVTSYIHE